MVGRFQRGRIYRVTAIDHHSGETENENPVMTFVGAFVGFEVHRGVRFVRLSCVYFGKDATGHLDVVEGHARVIQREIVGVRDLGSALA